MGAFQSGGWHGGGGAGGAGGGGDLVHLATAELAEAAATITIDVSDFAGLGYEDLILSWQLRGTFAGAEVGMGLQFNGDTGGNYSHAYFWENGSVARTAASGGTQMSMGNASAATADAATWGVGEATIPGWERAIWTGALWQLQSNAANRHTNGSGRWFVDDPITSITFVPGANNWAAGSRVEVWGRRIPA